MNSRGVDLLHIAYGGFGGHREVVNRINESSAEFGIKTAVLGVTRCAEDQTDAASWIATRYVAVPSSHPSAAISRGFLRAVIADLKPRVILAHSHALIPEVLLWSRLQGASPALVVRETHASNLRTWKDNIRSRISLRYADALVFVSLAQVESYPFPAVERGSRPVRAVIPNGVPSVGPRARDRLQLDEARFTIGMACRIVPGKRIELLLRVSARLIELGLPLKLIVAGSGPYRERLEYLASQLLQPNEFLFLGELSRSEMFDFYNSLGLYVHLTDGEGESNAVLEAAGHGLPIVLSETGTKVRSEINQGEFIFVPNDVETIAAEILALSSDRPRLRRMGDRNLEFVARERSIESMIGAYYNLFSRVDPSGPWLSVLE